MCARPAVPCGHTHIIISRIFRCPDPSPAPRNGHPEPWGVVYPCRWRQDEALLTSARPGGGPGPGLLPAPGSPNSPTPCHEGQVPGVSPSSDSKFLPGLPRPVPTALPGTRALPLSERGHSGLSQGPLERSLPTAPPASAAQGQEWGWAAGQDRAPKGEVTLAARTAPGPLLTSEGSRLLICSVLQNGARGAGGPPGPARRTRGAEEEGEGQRGVEWEGGEWQTSGCVRQQKERRFSDEGGGGRGRTGLRAGGSPRLARAQERSEFGG